MSQKFEVFLARFVRIEPGEKRAVFTAFALMFCVMGGYFAVRPIRETVGTILGEAVTSDTWIWTAVFAIAIIPVYGFLVARVSRATLVPAIYGTVAVALAAAGMVFQADPQNMVVGRIFYVGISVINLFLISVFWSFLLEFFQSEQTKRLFGFIAAGGTTGALVGPFITERIVNHVGISGILFFGAALFAVAIFCQRALVHEMREHGLSAAAGSSAAQAARATRGVGGNPFAGVAIVLKSPYLLGIALFVIMISTANTILYFEQLRLVKDMFEDPEQRAQMFARIDFIVQALTVVSQVLITGRVAQKLGVTALLVILPLLIMGGFLLLASMGTFLVLACVMVLRRWGEYAFIRPGREMLWSRLDTETKYKAKNFIDVTVYRFSDAVVAQVQDALKGGGMNPAQGALLGAGVCAMWAVNGWWLGRKFDKGKQ
ncbi:MAG TPA: MFS transporter [Steroidobacteraceae bacterium]|nr:MFS transporter [Steroidobacteraceae bacterium]